MNPRTVCFCHPIWSIISARVAPFFRCSMATARAVLLPSRGAWGFGDSGALTGSVGPLAGVTFLERVAAAALGLPPVAAFRLRGAFFFGPVFFFAEAFSGPTLRPGAARVACV